MASNRHFLGWNGPALPRAAAWLVDHCRTTGRELRHWTVVVPGSRAARRLLEALIEQTEGKAIAPPRIVTAGHLPETLYTTDRAVADDLDVLLARLAALRNVSSQRWQTLTPHPPADDDLTGRISLAQQIQSLHETLAADARTFADAAAHCAQAAPAQQPRWEALVELHDAYLAALDAMHKVDRHTARFDAACRAEQPILLVGAADLNRMTRRMLEQVADHVTALVHAPPDMADRFDAFGCILPNQWADAPLELDQDNLIVVDKPRDMADAVIRTIARDRPALDAITIGLGDESEGPALRRALQTVGLPAHLPSGRTANRTPPALLLDALATYAGSARFDDFAALVRHGDFEAYARQRTDDPTDAPLHDLDLHAAEALPTRIDPEAAPLLHEAVRALLSDDGNDRKPLSAWSEPIADVLRHVYAHRTLRRHHPDDAETVETIEKLGDLLAQQAEKRDDAPHVNFAEAIRLTLARLDPQTTSPDVDDVAIEMLGWLELQLDDAPLLIITSVNEGNVPQSLRAHPFLPDALRRELGLADNARRFARDRMMLQAILESRKTEGRVVLIAARRDAQDNPLTPSRLTLACEPRKLPDWVDQFYGEDQHAPPPLQLIPPGRNRFVIPVPHPPAKPIEKLSVTAFRDYLTCPYRFYLKHVERLEGIDDRIVEMDGMAFGNLAHGVLKKFGQSAVADSADRVEIADWLSAQLDRAVEAQYGKHPRPAILLQAEMLRRRLDAFAYFQAKRRRDGWRIVPELVEVRLQSAIEVDGEPFTITGQIDRVDVHDAQGHALLDYKTGDSGLAPDKIHRNADEWIDLQLPLYRDLAAARGIMDDVQLGYINLPKAVADVGLEAAPWTDDDLLAARDVAIEVIRNIRAGVFFPPAAPPRWADDYTAICMDAYDQREQIIRQMREASS